MKKNIHIEPGPSFLEFSLHKKENLISKCNISRSYVQRQLEIDVASVRRRQRSNYLPAIRILDFLLVFFFDIIFVTFDQ